MPKTDIVINLGGSAAKTITARANALDRLATSVSRVHKAFSSAPLQAATAGMKNFGGQIKKVTANAKTYERGVANAGARTDRFGTKIKGAGNALDNFGTLFRRMVRIMAAFFVITAVTRAVREFTTTLAQAPMQMELWNKQLVVLSGNATLAAERLELLKRVAIETPLELPDLFQGLTTLQAFNVEISERTLPLITDLAAVAGRTFQEVAEVIGKVIAGSPTAITRSLPTLAIAPAEFKALAAELGSRSEAIFQLIEEKFEGFAKESATTVIGVISNIKDAYFVVMADIGEALMVPLRESTQAIMDWLMELRSSPARLRELQDKVMLVGDELVRMVEAMWNAVVVVMKFTDAIGGLNVAIAGLLSYIVGRALVLKILAISAAVKTAQVGMAAWVVRGFNPWITGAGVVLGLLGALYARHRSQGDAVRVATLRNQDFANQLGTTNKQLEKNIQLVDAQTRAQQGQSVRGLGVALGVEASRADFKSERAGPLVDRARTLAMGLPDKLAQQKVREELAVITREINRARQAQRAGNQEVLKQTTDDIKAAMMEIAGVYSAQGSFMEQQSRDIMANMELAPTSIGDTSGGDEGKITDWFKALMARWGKVFSEGIDAPLELLGARLSAGLIDPDAARSGAQSLLDNWKDTFEQLIGSTDPLDQAIGMNLKPHVTNLEEFIADLNSQITDGFNQEFTELKLQMELGMDDEVATTALLALKDKIMKQMEILEDTLTPAMKDAFKGILSGINSAIEGLKPDDLSQALEQTLRMIIKQGSDVVAEALAAMITPDMGVSLSQAVGQLFSGMLQIMGDAMVQIGIGALLLSELFKDITNPASAAALIAGGIVLKAMAKAIGGRMKESAKSGGSGGAGAPGPMNYPQFSPGAYGDKRSWYVEINAVDAASFEQLVLRNPVAFGRGISLVAREDKATGGQAHGAFVPA
jgi:hypothetical protein